MVLFVQIQRHFFSILVTPLPTAKLRFLGKYFLLFHRSPPLVVLSPKNITCVFSIKTGGISVLMDPLKDFKLIFMPSLIINVSGHPFLQKCK